MARRSVGAAAARDSDITTRAETMGLIRPYAPTGYLRSNIDRMAGLAPAGVSPLASGRMTLTALYLQAGEVVNNLSFISGTTAGATLTHTWFALYTPALALARQTNDDTSATWAASTMKTLNLSSAYTVPTTGIYYAALMCAGTTMPTFIGASTSTVLFALPPVLNGTSNAALTTTAPSTANAIAAAAAQPFVLAA